VQSRFGTRKREIRYIFRCGKRKPGYPEVPGPKPALSNSRADFFEAIDDVADGFGGNGNTASKMLGIRGVSGRQIITPCSAWVDGLPWNIR